MDQTVRDYLIKAHKKVIAHYHQVLQASSLPQSECVRIQHRLAAIEAEIETLRRGGSNPRLAQAA